MIAVLKAYQRLVAAEFARGQAVVEHAGPVSASVLDNIAAAMTKKYSRKVVSVARPNPALLAGLRVRVGDDVYESSVAGQLAALGASV
jgi:F-type H+-transporting ATPase subunit delta